MNEENKKAEVTENKKEVSKTEANKTRKFDKKRPRNNNIIELLNLNLT